MASRSVRDEELRGIGKYRWEGGAEEVFMSVTEVAMDGAENV